jgi:hypothetical protein
MGEVEARLDELEAEGFIVIEGAMTPEETEHIRQRVNYAREQGWEEGLNAVGNMWFDSLLDREPEHYGQFVGHKRLRPYLEGMMGPQCQLRSLRAHINPGPYLQEWHMDFYGYWDEKRKAASYRLTETPVGVNTTFYLQDNDPAMGHLKFVTRGHLVEPDGLSPHDRPTFEEWCESQDHVVIHPNAGDAVVFLSHIPHQGAKHDDSMERSNVVCHYQLTPMHERAWHVSRPRGFADTFPFSE